MLHSAGIVGNTPLPLSNYDDGSDDLYKIRFTVRHCFPTYQCTRASCNTGAVVMAHDYATMISKKSPKTPICSKHEKRYFLFRNGAHSKNVYSKCTHVGGVMLSICSLWRTKRDLRIHALGEKSRKKENP